MTLTGRMTSDGSVKVSPPWLAMAITIVLGIGGAAMSQVVVSRVMDQKHESKNQEQDRQIETLFATVKGSIADMSTTIKDVIRSEAEHTREIARIQFDSFGSRLDKHEEMIEELQKERRAIYQTGQK